MQLEEIGIALRPRSGAEALDLGRVMMFSWFGGAWRALGVTYVPVGLILLLVLWQHQFIAFLLVWWLKPVADRALLFAFSRSLFGKDTAMRDVLKAMPGLLRHSALFSALTFRRLSLRRSFLLPVWQLEGQRGKAARRRCRVLSSRVDNLSVGLTAFCALMSLILALSIVILIQMFVPEGREGLFHAREAFDGEAPAGILFFFNVVYMIAVSIVEPFYVASGFALYLNRRSELEGWDIELAFRRLSSRKAEE